jgi:polar amino acid transport system permease protein
MGLITGLKILLLSKYMPNFIQGTLVTLQMAIIIMCVGTMIGTVGALVKISQNHFFRALISIYVELFRNTPCLVQMFIIYFGFPSIGINFDPYAAALIALTINCGAYSTEVMRAGIQSVNVQQIKAAHSLGINKLQTFRYVIFPQAFRAIYFPLTNQFILTTLGTSLAAAIAVEELTYKTMEAGSLSFHEFEAFLIAAIIYLTLAQILTNIFRYFGIFILKIKTLQRRK